MVRDHSHELTRRQIMSILGAAGATGLAGCGGDDGGTESPGGDGTGTPTGDGTTTPTGDINFWSKEVQAPRTELISGIASDYSENNPGEVKPIFIAQGDLATQLTASISTGDVPTLIQGFNRTAQQLANEDLVATDSIANVIDAVGRDKFADGPLSFFAGQGESHIGVPIDGWATSIFYRKSAFEEAGLEPPNTWEATLAAAKEFHDPDNNMYGIGIATTKGAYMLQCLAHFGLANGVQIFDADGNIAFDSQETIDTLSYYADIAQYTAPGDVSFTKTRQNYENERSHMTIWSPYIIDDILNNVGQSLVDDTGVTQYMEKSQKAAYGVINGLTISSLSSDDDKEIAEGFAEYLMSGQTYIDWLHMAPGGKQPVLKPVSEKSAYQDNEVLNAWGDKMQKISGALGNAKAWGKVGGQTFAGYGAITAQQLISTAGQRAVNGDDPATIASEMADQMRQAIE